MSQAKKTAVILVMATVALIAAGCSKSPTESKPPVTYNKFITVTNQIAGANFHTGDSIEVTWTSNGITGPLEIRLDYPGFSDRIITSTQNDGRETIAIPSDCPDRCDWHVVVTDYDDDAWDVSDDFCIE